MPLFFLLAGWSAAASLRSRGVTAFLRERVSKLAVPLIAGCALLVPPIKYLELRGGQDLNHRGLFVSPEVRESVRSVLPIDLPLAAPFHEDFFTFLPTFFGDLDRFTWSHLWFLAYLLAFTVLLLPVLARLAARSPAAGLPARLWAYAPMLPLVLVQLTLRERFPGPYNLYRDWANVAFFLTFLASGFALAVAPGLEERLRGEWRRLLALGVAATGLLLAAALGWITAAPVVLVASAVAAWCFVAALLGFTRERTICSSRRLGYLAESAFPIYVLHQPVIVLLGAGVVTLPVGIAAKFPLLFAGSIAVTLAIYHSLVRRFALPRFLLGMKPRRRAPAVARSVSAPSRAALLALLALPFAAHSAQALEPTGRWWAEGGAAEVAIEPCDDALCGRITWLRHPLGEDGCAVRDAQNPEPALRARSLAGLTILRALRPSPDTPGEWSGGEIYDPSSGRTYQAALAMDGPDRLLLRGYLGIRLLGRTAIWIRVGAENRCSDPA
jgi:uncharacterized protein (DUF2147 family)